MRWKLLVVVLAVTGVAALVASYLAEGRWFDRAPTAEELAAPPAWEVQQIDGFDLTDQRVLLTFDADYGLTLMTACRALTGEAVVDTDGLAFGVSRLTSSEPPCPGNEGDAERLVQSAFDRTNGWVIRDDGCSIEIYGLPEEPLMMWLAAPCG